MENVSSKQINKYINVLNLNPNEDLKTLIQKYQIAIVDYIKNDIYNVEKLKLIVEGFKFFSGFNKEVFNMPLICNIAISLLNDSRKASDCYIYEFISMYSFIIGQKLNVLNNLDEESSKRDAKIIYQLMTTIEPIMNFELEQLKQIDSESNQYIFKNK